MKRDVRKVKVEKQWRAPVVVTVLVSLLFPLSFSPLQRASFAADPPSTGRWHTK